MNMKEKGLVPSVSAVIAARPTATLNPETQEPFTAKVILEVFRSKCYDTSPQVPWSYTNPKNKTALSPEVKTMRWDWVKKMFEINHQSVW